MAGHRRGGALSANLQYLNTNYDELRYQQYSTTGAQPISGCPITPTTLAGASAAAPHLQCGLLRAPAAERAQVGDRLRQATGFVNNTEDEIVFANSLQSPAKPGVLYNQLRPPRTYGVRLSMRM